MCRGPGRRPGARADDSGVSRPRSLGSLLAARSPRRDHLLAVADEGGYAETLAVLVPAEWTYLDWATSVDDPPEREYLREWVALHANDEFAGFVDWLRAELDDELPALSQRRRRRVEARFDRTVRLEAEFFAAAYDDPPHGATTRR